MTDINNELIEKTAELSKLEILPCEMEAFKEDFQEILGFMETLKNINEIEDYDLQESLTGENVIRDDCVLEYNISREILMSNAPDMKGGCFTVPRAVE